MFGKRKKDLERKEFILKIIKEFQKELRDEDNKLYKLIEELSKKNGYKIIEEDYIKTYEDLLGFNPKKVIKQRYKLIK
jgi:predicted KAP-like P-loop ATPase